MKDEGDYDSPAIVTHGPEWKLVLLDGTEISGTGDMPAITIHASAGGGGSGRPID